jgi:predicted glycogen debranching enzyme
VRLLAKAGADRASRTVQQLTLAADQFLVERRSAPDPRTSASRTVIAGYHWFNDWGRDTMISLPGLTLATGRPAEAADILRAFGPYVRDGLLPNNFPDDGGADPSYNTADAALWYVWAVHAYAEATGDEALVDDLLGALRDVVDCYARGTRYGIGVDPADGLLRAGEPGLQLTWMDAKLGDWVVTPRIGKPVELNALWYNALRTLASLLAVRDGPAADGYAAQAERARLSFLARFRRPECRHLADVVDGPDGDDWTLRPNQILAVSLPFPLLEGAAAEPVVEAVGQALLADVGLRSLAPDDPAYHGAYTGGPGQRDGSYHQGPVWAWLLGPYVEAHYRVYGDRAAALALLEPIEHHLRDAGLGTVSEIFEGDPPYLPRGCIAQAWSVAEILRVWQALAQDPAAP